MEGWVFLLILIIGVFIFSFIGVIVLLVRTSRQEESLKRLRRLVERLQENMPAPAAEAERSKPPEATAPSPVDEITPLVPVGEAAVSAPLKETAAPVAAEREEPGKTAATPSEQTMPARRSRLNSALLAFVKSGNLWAAGGVILLTAGFGTLIAYLGRRGFFTVEMGIAAAAAAGLAMILFGWRFRLKRPVYFLILQGGGIGILYLAIFAAHKFTDYLGVPLSLALMTLLIPPTVILALFQNSHFLAMLGFLGGFAAPILLSTGGGNHLFLFIYYTILNAGVLAIGFFRNWKGLNLLAFFFSFGISLYWTMTSFVPEFFKTTEPFFIVFTIAFTVLGLRSLKNSASESAKIRFHPGDMVIVLGTPAASASLQWKIFSHIAHGYSIIAVAFSAFYILLTIGILKKWISEKSLALRPWAEAYLALGVLLANLAIPLELAPNISGAIWAAEGALLFYIGLRMSSQARIMAAGLIVHAAAAVAFIRDLYIKRYAEDPAQWRSPAFTGAIIIALSALAMAIFAEKLGAGREGKKKNLLAWIIALWGFVWWFGGFYYEFTRILPAPGDAFLVLASASALLSALALKFSGIGFFAAGMVPAPLAAAFMALGVLENNMDLFFPYQLEYVFTHNFFESSIRKGWLSFLVLQFLTIWILRPAKKPEHEESYKNKPAGKPAWFHDMRIFIYTLTALAVLSASGRFFTMNHNLSPSWTSLAGLLPLFLLLVALPLIHGKFMTTAEPRKTGRNRRTLLYPVLPYLLSGILGLWFMVTLFLPGNPSPLPFYVPVLNPLDLLEGLCIATILYWQVKNEKQKTGLIILGDLMVFFWIVSILARSIHYYAGISWRRVSVSDAFQLSLFIFWALYGIFHIILGHRKKMRLPWIAGAILVALDIAKLILLDMRDIGAVPRILSFFAAGLVLLFIGWAAPLPPSASLVPDSNQSRPKDDKQ